LSSVSTSWRRLFLSERKLSGIEKSIAAASARDRTGAQEHCTSRRTSLDFMRHLFDIRRHNVVTPR
jgi:hypothetical protein